MRVRLLRDVYAGMEDVPLPVEVEAEIGPYGNCMVHEDELARIGSDMTVIADPEDPFWPFSPGSWEAVE